jgi:hypothetical protein
MLERALDSVVAQTYPHWRAIVFDDSLSLLLKGVVKGVADDRIVYSHNPQRLGAAANIDQCFSSTERLGGTYACLLEDDNFWQPDFLSSIAEKLEADNPSLILVNQRINEEGVGLRPPQDTTRGDWFADGLVTPLDLRARLLLMEGLSNGGLVWQLGGEIDLRVGASVRETGLHEACRSLLVAAPFLFIKEPHAVWTSMPKSGTARANESNRTIGRGMQSIRDYVLRVHGNGVVGAAKLLASQLGLASQLVAALAYSGRPVLAGELIKGRKILAGRALVKGLAIRFAEKDPCAAFFTSARPVAVP